MTRRVVGIVLAARVDVLDDGLGVGAVVWPYAGADPIRCSENTRWECKGLEICPLSGGCILEDNQQTGIVKPFDLEATTDALPIREGALDVLRLELFGEATEIENTRD